MRKSGTAIGHAERCRNNAETAQSAAAKDNYLLLEQCWLRLAQSDDHSDPIGLYLAEVDRLRMTKLETLPNTDYLWAQSDARVRKFEERIRKLAREIGPAPAPQHRSLARRPPQVRAPLADDFPSPSQNGSEEPAHPSEAPQSGLGITLK